GVSEEKSKQPKQEFRIYPNPASGPVNLDLHADIKQLTLFDASGRQIKKPQPSKKITLNLPPGIYFLRIETHCKIRTKKIIILR
ncbi:MAG TPA: T9SS type A sorting domain-containing protein, partial [bacterium (Candidatus Stahlbacteria)]|nr:T9SS type A sorting domain-containing protein [Candidatus Stahlbacteria bacterium]